MTTSMQNLTRVFRANRTILVVLGFLIVWELAGRILEPPSYLLPLPSSILQELAKRPQLYLYNGLYTALNTIAAFVLATVLGRREDGKRPPKEVFEGVDRDLGGGP